MTEKQKQLFYSGMIGDGSLRENGRVYYSSIELEYMEFKYNILKDITGTGVKTSINQGFKKAPIHSFSTLSTDFGKELYKLGPEEAIKNLDEFGLAIWFLDDGSLHHKNHFYNLCTHSFSKEFQEDVIIPKLEEFGLEPTILVENKKDGRVFYYINIKRYNGAIYISNLISELGLSCFERKQIPQDFLDKYNYLSKKYKGKEIAIRSLTNLLNMKSIKEIDSYLENSLKIYDNRLSPSGAKIGKNNSSNTLIL